MSEAGILLEIRQQIAVVTIKREDKRNAFSEQMWSDLERITIELSKDTPRAIVLTGAGAEAFSAGFDISPDNPQVATLTEAIQQKRREPVAVFLNNIRRVIDGFLALPVPVIAAINGLAYGGGAELAVRCDLRVVDPKAVICFSEVRLGLMPDLGGGVALTRLIGSSRASDLILTAREVRPDEALELGMVNRISEPGQVLPASLALAESIAENGPRATRCALEIIRRTQDMPAEEALELEKERAIDLITSGECYYGISAFMTKTEPIFPDI
ncbi:enoyl-CoA hydratase/isomerase family protein [candidate division CSSED10-310 bacterium]|uniref:Enoyl-CoA hydratase/isomerase family protein n=1 Tax=candidate division CSSED10-310 bacterium TaxID=2855610 RepID=A0ABV6YZB2_UNCC1